MRFGLVEDLYSPTSPPRATDRLEPALGELLGGSVTVVFSSSYAALTQRFVHHEVDVAWLTPAMLVEAARGGAPIGRIVTAVRRGASAYAAALVVRDEGGAEALADLAGGRAGWVDPWSAAGYLFPRRLLRRAGFDPGALFVEQRFYRSHQAVLAAIEAGEVDVGAVFCGLSERDAVPWGPTLRALARTEAIPGDALCVSSHLGDERSARVASSLCSDEAVEVARMLQAERFVERRLEDYGPVREALEDEWGRSSREP